MSCGHDGWEWEFQRGGCEGDWGGMRDKDKAGGNDVPAGCVNISWGLWWDHPLIFSVEGDGGEGIAGDHGEDPWGGGRRRTNKRGVAGVQLGERVEESGHQIDLCSKCIFE